MTLAPCIYCVEKHVAKAAVYFGEARAGYPGRYGLALGELAAAEEEAGDRWPTIRHHVRAERKALEGDRRRYMPGFEHLLAQIEAEIQVLEDARGGEGQGPADAAPNTPPRKMAPGDGPAIAPPPRHQAPPPGLAPCVNCPQAAAQRSAAPVQEMQEAPVPSPPAGLPAALPAEPPAALAAEPPDVLILVTALSSFEASYSLVPVILDQARAAHLAGWQVHLIGMTNMPITGPRAADLPAQITMHPVLPNVGWVEDALTPAKTDKIREAIIAVLDTIQSKTDARSRVLIISHDLLFQSWYVTAATAWHDLANIDQRPHICQRAVVIHQMHSSVGTRPTSSNTWVRTHLPTGHFLGIVNHSDAEAVAYYYETDKTRIESIPNTRDVLNYHNVHESVRKIIDTGISPHTADISCVYPLSSTRMSAKGLKHVLAILAILAKTHSVRLIVPNAHANGAEARREMETHKRFAEERGLIYNEPLGIGMFAGQRQEAHWIFTSDIDSSYLVAGLPQEAIANLFHLSNVFIFPSVSEACGLVMLEAAACKNLLVLNRSLDVLSDFIPHNEALWYDFGSIRRHVDPATLEQVYQTAADDIVRELSRNKADMSFRRVAKKSSLATLATRMRNILDRRARRPPLVDPTSESTDAD